MLIDTLHFWLAATILGLGGGEDLGSRVTFICDKGSSEEHVLNIFSDTQASFGQAVLGRDLRVSLHRVRGVPKVLPVLWGVCEWRHDVLLYEEEHWQEEPQTHGAHHWPDGEGLDRGQHEQALRWVVVKFGHWKEKGNNVRRHLLVQSSTWTQVMFHPHRELLGTEAANQARCSGMWEPEGHTRQARLAVLIFFLHPLRTWLPSWFDRLLLVLVRHYMYLSKTKEGNLFSTDARRF